ncbi:MAG: hypothetical protein ACHQJ4_01400 [Ignavibacteria bacterium]
MKLKLLKYFVISGFFLALVILPHETRCSCIHLNEAKQVYPDSVKTDDTVTEIETIIFVPYNDTKKKDTTSARHDTTSSVPNTESTHHDTASTVKDTSSVSKDTSSADIKHDTSSVKEETKKNDPPVRQPLVMGPGIYRLIRVDSVVFAKSYLLIMENFQQDTIFILSDRIVRHYDGTDENYGEPVAVNNLYRLKFYKIDNMFQEKLGFRYRTIEHLEIRFGSIIFYTDQLIQVPIHYTTQMNGLYYSPPPDDETIINLDNNR